MLDPELRIIAHLPWRVAHGRFQVVADERAGEIAGDLRRVDDRGAGRDQRLQILHDGEAFAQGALGLLAVGDVGPRSDDFEGLARFVGNHFECVLDPKVVPVTMAETVFDRASSLGQQAFDLGEDLRSILGVQPRRPELGSSSISQAEKPMIGSTLSLTNVHLNAPEAWFVYMMPGATDIRYLCRSRAAFSSTVRSSTRCSNS